MAVFTDRLLLQFLQDNFVTDLLTNQLGLNTLFGLVYALESVELRQLDLTSVARREFALPAFETLRTHGTDELIVPRAERTRLDRTHPRKGRLAWVDIFLDLVLSAKVAETAGRPQSLTVKNLLDKIGKPVSFPDLRAKLGAIYPPSIVDAFLTRRRITTVEQFLDKPALFLEIVSSPPPAFDPNDPAVVRQYRLRVCVQVQPEFRLGESLQAAKLCRTILTSDPDSIESTPEYDLERPYAFVVIFPNAGVDDNTIPNMTGAEVKTRTRDLFRAEGMLAHFV
jgi:hypothetical protein